jgi:hypothetical protein
LAVAVFAAAVSACTGPAAKKASRHAGASRHEIARCETRSCFLGLLKYGGEVLVSTRHPDGSLEEVYQVSRERGSSLRSFTHGILSVATLGIWNVVGYPLEGFMSSADFIVFRVTYDAQGEPTKVEIQGS